MRMFSVMDEVTGTERGRGWRTGGCGVPEVTQGFWEKKGTAFVGKMKMWTSGPMDQRIGICGGSCDLDGVKCGWTN